MKPRQTRVFAALLSSTLVGSGNGPAAAAARAGRYLAPYAAPRAPESRSQPAPAPTRDVGGASSAPFWTGIADAKSFEGMAEARMARAREALDRLIAVKAPRTIDNTLRPFDDVLLELDAVGSQAGLIQVVHPDETMRRAAETISQKVSALGTELSLHRGAYDAITALDVSHMDPETRHYVQRTLRDFRLAGVDKDEATRKRIQQLNDELTVIGQDFSRNIRSDLRKVIA